MIFGRQQLISTSWHNFDYDLFMLPFSTFMLHQRSYADIEKFLRPRAWVTITNMTLILRLRAL